jgi:hypothetical protein
VSNRNELSFSLSDRINGAEVGPARVPFGLLVEFQKDVGEFLRGSAREVDTSEVLVSVEEGSLLLVVSGLISASTLWADLNRLKSPNSLNLIDPKRAAVVERWQSSARQNPDRRYRVTDREAGDSLVVNANTNFRKAEEVWVTVEKYIHGKVLNWGGKTKPNVHLEMSDGSSLIVAASHQLLGKEEHNRLYRSALLHITAEENLMTGTIRNPVLLSFETHQPIFDETEFREMVRRGTVAWSDVSSATDWVEEIRGGRA